MSNNSTLPIIAVGALGLSSVSCVISSLTGFLLSDDSNVESNTSTSNTSTDTSNTSTDTSNTSTDTSNTSTETDYTIPHQIGLGTDGWCVETDAVHQDVPGCGRICSTAINVGSKRDGTWGPWADNSTVASTCVGAKLDEIWELQDDGIRKLADGYVVSSPPTAEAVAEAAAEAAAAPPYTINEKTRFRPSKMRYGYVNILDGSKSKYSTNSLMSDTTVDACISKCNELDKCTSFQWVPGDKYCNMVSDKPFSEGSLLSTMIESNDRYEIHIKP